MEKQQGETTYNNATILASRRKAVCLKNLALLALVFVLNELTASQPTSSLGLATEAAMSAIKQINNRLHVGF